MQLKSYAKKILWAASLIPFSGLSVYSHAATLNLQVLSAVVKDQKIAGANVILQRNGEQSQSAQSDNQGLVRLNSPFADDINSTLIIKKAGYSNLVAKCPCNGLTYALSPTMRNLDGMRIVLTWGAKPEDLDSHLVYPNNHVYFSNKTGTDANLDVDDTTSYGPETITLERKHDGERYVYAVHNYTDRARLNSSTLSNSQAKVFVYIGDSLIRTYAVPQGKRGNLWTVFAVNEAGNFEDYNVIEGVESQDRLNTAAFQSVIGHVQPQTPQYASNSLNLATRLNQQGEQAYHAGQLAQAIDYYQQAIEQRADFGQAYSNLGLAYQKAGRTAEALWANRKAIALASGNDANQVKANSYYNNARIYENAGQLKEALREYRRAAAAKSNPVYSKAIQRLQQQGVR